MGVSSRRADARLLCLQTAHQPLRSTDRTNVATKVGIHNIFSGVGVLPLAQPVPWIIIGHSMGCWLGYELWRTLRAKHGSVQAPSLFRLCGQLLSAAEPAAERVAVATSRGRLYAEAQ